MTLGLMMAALLFSTNTTAQVMQARFGHIDTQALLEAMPERENIQTEIEGAAAQYEQEIVRMQGELEAKLAEYQQKAEPGPPPSAPRRSRTSPRTSRSRADVQQELGMLEQSLEPMIEDLPAIEEWARKRASPTFSTRPPAPRSTAARTCRSRQGQAWPLRPHRDFDSGIGG